MRAWKEPQKRCSRIGQRGVAAQHSPHGGAMQCQRRQVKAICCVKVTSGRMMRQTAILVVLLVICCHIGSSTSLPTRPHVVSVGAFCTFNSSIGKVAKVAIAAAVDDVNSSPKVLSGTKLKLSILDTANDGFLGIVEALSFMENNTVAIIGPQFSAMAHLISHIANELQIPHLSYAATDPTLSSEEFPFFVRTTQSDLFQMSAIADIVEYYGWKYVITLYVDDDYGRNGVAVLGDKLAEKRCRISYKAPMSTKMNKHDITNMLLNVASMESRILILHTYADLGLKVFDVAKDLGMMASGYVWITSDWFSTLLDTNMPLPAKAIDSIQGVLTLRMHTPDSKIKRKLFSRWKKLAGTSASGSIRLNAYGLYAYDTVWLLAHALDDLLHHGNTISFSNDSKLSKLSTRNLHFYYMPIFNQGNLLLQNILKVNMTGVTGMMKFTTDGSLVHPAYEVINVVGTSLRKIGYWSNFSGLSVFPPETMYSKSKPLNGSGTISSGQLYGVVWPGQTTVKPNGWVYPNNGKRLKIGIPNQNFFREILYQVEGTNRYAGYCIDVFAAALDLLPYAIPYQFIPGINGHHYPTSDELLHRVTTGVYDAMVGDISITNNRTRMVDFTQPYIESGLVVVAPVRKLNSSAWAFLMPFTPMMWCVTGLFFLIVGTAIWILERRKNDEFRGTPRKQVLTILWFSFSTLFFAHREKTVSNLSRFLLVVWLFVVLILNSTYTASLSSILTVEKLSSPIKGIESLMLSNDPIGYHKGSFAENYLTKELNIQHSRLVPLKSPEEYEKALKNGPNGGVAAVVDERVYMELFLSQRCEFGIVGRDFAKLGWGFAFQRDSPLAIDMSNAILKLSENGELQRIRDKWLKQSACSTEGANQEVDRLQLKSFSGLFFLCGLSCFVALLVYFIQTVHKFIKHQEGAQSSTLTSGSAVLQSFVSFMNEKEDKIERQSMRTHTERVSSASGSED